MPNILDAYQRVAGLSKLYDAMLTNAGFLGRLALKIFWGLDSAAYEKFLAQAFAGVPCDFNGRLLEVPVGTGVLSLPRYKRLNAEIFCVDLSEKMLDVAKARASQLNLRGVQFIRGDAASLPFADEFFDLVLSVNGFHVFPDKAAAWSDTRRVLRGGGIFCGCMYVKGVNRRTDFFIEQFCERQGFFSPPHETLTTLQARLHELYRRVEVTHVKSFAGFVCRK